MAAATSQISMDTNSMWNQNPPVFDGREYPGNMVGSETSSGHAAYPYDAGRPHLTCKPPLVGHNVPKSIGNRFSDPIAPTGTSGAGYSAPSHDRRPNTEISAAM